MNKNLCSVHNVHGIGEKHSPSRWSLEFSASVLGVRAVCWVGVVSQHVVVHVNGGAVVKGITQALSEDGLARVRGQAKKEETGLSGWKSVDGPVHLDDLELLRDISQVGGQPGPARDEA